MQDTVIVVERGAGFDSRSRVAREAVDFFNDRATTRIFGSFSVSSDERISGDIAVYDGPIRVSGVIRGDLVVINGDVRLSRTAIIRGGILVLGGSITGLTRARVDGNTRVYRSSVRVRRQGNRLVLLDRGRVTRLRTSRRRTRFSEAEASLVVSTGGTYNRVEGLPIHLGPRLEWRTFGSPHFRLEALAILRSAGGLDSLSDDVGYTAGVEWNVGGNSPVTLGGRVFDLVAPIEAWQLHNDEIGFAALLWHRDYRDYYTKQGYAGYLMVEPADGFTISVEVSRHEDNSIAQRDPWTPFRGGEPWRLNPAIDVGKFTTIVSSIEYDSRPYRNSPSSGWFVSGEWERGLSDDVIPQTLPPAIRDPLPVTGTYTYDRIFVDLRRYERLGWNGQLSLRAVGAGTLGENDPLPIQRRLSLGGPGPMPGFGFRHLACNSAVADLARPALCDRVLLFQAAYRGNLSFSTSSRRGERSRRRRVRNRSLELWDRGDWFWLDGPTIVLFGDAGTAWIGDDGPGEFEGDVGAGIEFGSFGFYGAKAVTNSESVRLSLRIHRRF
jgi:hypothetical protein